jgi:hypothetical protein
MAPRSIAVRANDQFHLGMGRLLDTLLLVGLTHGAFSYSDSPINSSSDAAKRGAVGNVDLTD